MTATPPVTDEQAQYKGLGGLLPRLAQPSWPRWITSAKLKPIVEITSIDKQAAKKEAKQKYHAYKRLHDAIRGDTA